MEIGPSQEREPDCPGNYGSSASKDIRSNKDLRIVRQRIEDGYYTRPEIIDAVVDILIRRPEIVSFSDK